jgi:hypothetical protein
MKYYNFDVCEISDDKQTVTCLGFDGKVYVFPLPKEVSYAECDPRILENLIRRSQQNRREHE